jgi:hypothetical protein
MRYNLTAEFIPGKDLTVADALLRAPLCESESQAQKELESDITVYVDAVREAWSISDQKLQALKKATSEDVMLSYALQYTRDGWSQYKEDVKLAARQLFNVKDELSEYDGLLVRGSRIVIPFSYRDDIVGRIHDGHQGIVKCRERANECVWWPGMGQDIKNMVSKCKHCIEKSPTQKKEPIIPSPLPSFPFQKVGVDLCEKREKTT